MPNKKNEIELKAEYVLSKKVVHCKKAIQSYHDATKSVMAQKKASLTRQLIHQIERLASGQRMSKEHFPPEGDLPAKSAYKKFYALKRIPIRGYCWQSTKYPNTYYISHYIHKDFDKLRPKDVELVHNNWTRVEVSGDEC